VEYITPNSSVSIFSGTCSETKAREKAVLSVLIPLPKPELESIVLHQNLRYQIAPADTISPLLLRKKDGGTPIGVAVITTGLGARTGAPDKWNLVFLWNAELVNYDALDAVHNYSDGARNHSRAVV
jgi:hypothetical protein